jgi:hypothetical protein
MNFANNISFKALFLLLLSGMNYGFKDKIVGVEEHSPQYLSVELKSITTPECHDVLNELSTFLSDYFAFFDEPLEFGAVDGCAAHGFGVFDLFDITNNLVFPSDSI